MSVLITGGTGFFGQGLVRRLLETESRICVYSRNEWLQAKMRMELGNDKRLRWFIGDVRDQQRLRVAMDGVRTVFHAAALKRVEVGEYNPTEMVRTNVEGAINIIAAAKDRGVENVVALSSDKACEPLNCYGATKLVSEKLFIAANETKGPAFAVARYGNVAGSTGSIIPIWRALIAEKKPVQITDPECTRFWMTLGQAVEMVLACVGKREIFVPELPAYKLSDLAEAMGTEFSVTGLGKAEKLHEKMVSDAECRMLGLKNFSSETARRMTVEELKEALKDV